MKITNVKVKKLTGEVHSFRSDRRLSLGVREKQCLLAPEIVHVDYKCAGEETHRGSAFIRSSSHPQPTLGTPSSLRLSIACRHAHVIAKGTEQKSAPKDMEHFVKTFLFFSFFFNSSKCLLVISINHSAFVWVTMYCL